MRLIAGESALLTAVGATAGCIALVGVGFAIAPMLLQPVADPFTFAVSAAVLAAVAAIAGVIPARAAARSDISRVLRAD
jgi:ABC-type antimicrobial peptide transport system permease subunit